MITAGSAVTGVQFTVSARAGAAKASAAAKAEAKVRFFMIASKTKS